MKSIKFDNPNMGLYICSMKKLFRVTAICRTSVEANVLMEKDKNQLVIAEDATGLIYLAEDHGHIAPSAILDDMARSRPASSGAELAPDKNGKIVVRCMVSALNSNGDSDFHFCKVKCTPDQYEEGEHYRAAGAHAREEGFEPLLAYDECDSAGQAMLDMFNWEPAQVVTLSRSRVSPCNLK
jgi:hypothetical protein